MALQIRRGLQANLPSSPAEGELLYATDTGNLYIGVSGSPELISTSGSGGGNSNVSAISDLTDVASVSGIADGQALLWNAANSAFEYGNIPAGYANSDVQAYLASGTNADHIIPAGNELYDLGSSSNRFRDLYLSGSTIDLGGTTVSVAGGTLAIDSANLATVTEVTTANTEMQAYVDALETRIVGGANVSLDSLAEVANALANSNTELSTVAFTGNYTDINNRPSALSLSGNAYLLYDGANIDLTSVVGQTGATGAQGPQGNVGLTGAQGPQGNVGPQGPQGNAGVNGTNGTDGVSVSSATISTNDLVLTLSNAATINAGNVRGPVGPQGNVGATGPQGDGNAGISSGAVNVSGNLILTLNDSTTVDAGNVRGEIGATGASGVGITSTSLVGGNLVLNYSNTSTQDVGNIQGPQGDQGTTGATGATISSASVTNGAITLTMSDATTINVTGNVQGATGAQGAQGNVGATGADGTNISSGTVNGSGNLILTLSDASTIDAGNVRGADGDIDQTLTLNSTAGQLAISGSGGNNVDLRQTQFLYSALSDLPSASTYHGAIAHVHAEGAMYFAHGGNWVELANASDLETNTDAQTLSIAGNVITISGSDSNVDLTSALAGAGGGGSGNSNVQLTDFSVTTATPSGNGSLSYDDAGVFTFTPADTSGSGGGGSQNLFSNIAVSGQNTIVADSTTDTLTLAAGSGINITTNSTTDTVTIAATGGGGGGSGATVERFKLNYATNGNLDSTSNLSSGINTVSIDSATSGEVSIAFTGYNYPPASVMLYGYDYANNKYYMSHVETTMATREIAGGGTSGSPTLFDGSSTPTIKLRLRETETGASRSFGTTTHAWVHIVMHD